MKASFELRFRADPGTSTKMPVLQYRTVDDRGQWLPWQDVPTVVEAASQARPLIVDDLPDDYEV